MQNDRVRVEGWSMKKSTEIRLKRLAPSAQVTETTTIFPIRGVKAGGEVAAVLAVFDEVAPLASLVAGLVE